MNSLRSKLAFVVALVSAIALGTAPALAADDIRTFFQLDGNIIVNSGTPTVDWAALFDVNGTNAPTQKATLPSGFGPASFVRDFVPGGTSDASTFATGSKDIQNITDNNSTVSGSWQCAKSNNVNDKTDLLNAYAVAFVSPTNKELILYFGLETASNEGTRDVAFWFLKDKTVGCVAGAHATDFTGNHQNGDILITAEYTGSNGVSEIKAFLWVGDGTTGHLDTNPLTTGGDCGGGFPTLCGKTNGTPLIASLGQVPWLTQTKLGKVSTPGLTTADLDVGEFFEGGMNLTAFGLAGCFTQFLSDTRSSDTPTATIFDYSLGNFPLCGMSVGKVCDKTVQNNPHVVSGTILDTVFDVTIKNTGGFALSNVTIKEGLTFGTNEQCVITAITGGTDPTTVPAGGIVIGSATVTPIDVKVAGSLDAASSMDVTVECQSPNQNPFINTVIAKADGGLSATHTVSTKDGEACPFSVSPTVTPGKACTGVTIDGATLKPKVCVDISLTNNSSEDLTGVSITDNMVTAVNFPTTLAAGATKTVNRCYNPTSSDQTGDVCANIVTFSDQLQTITFTGDVSGKTVTLTTGQEGVVLPSATCNLCPGACSQ